MDILLYEQSQNPVATSEFPNAAAHGESDANHVPGAMMAVLL